MKVEVLFVPGCPNYEPALERLKRVLVSEGLDVEVHGVPAVFAFWYFWGLSLTPTG
jgi:hypothetical protein